MKRKRNPRKSESIQEYKIRAKLISSRYLTPECWSVQAWGFSHCRECEYLATEECGGMRIRKDVLRGKCPKDGLPGDDYS